jgi:hypothetical protein
MGAHNTSHKMACVSMRYTKTGDRFAEVEGPECPAAHHHAAVLGAVKDKRLAA